MPSHSVTLRLVATVEVEAGSPDEAASVAQSLHDAGVLEEPGRHDRRQPAAFGQAIERGVQMALQLLKRRVGDDGVEAAGTRQDVLQQDRVMAGARGSRKQPVENLGPTWGQFVEVEHRAARLGDNREKARAGRWL